MKSFVQGGVALDRLPPHSTTQSAQATVQGDIDTDSGQPNHTNESGRTRGEANFIHIAAENKKGTEQIGALFAAWLLCVSTSGFKHRASSHQPSS